MNNWIALIHRVNNPISHSSPGLFHHSPIFSFFQQAFYIGFKPDLITGAKNV
jgi:hypothetical protein